MYAVVQFISDQTYSEVPVSWLTDDRQYCYWPNKAKNAAHFIEKYVKPTKQWSKFAVAIECFCGKIIFKNKCLKITN